MNKFLQKTKRFFIIALVFIFTLSLVVPVSASTGDLTATGNVIGNKLCIGNSSNCMTSVPTNSQWTTSGSNIYYNNGSVDIGTQYTSSGNLNFPNNGGSIAWESYINGAGPYSKIYDSGDLHIWTDDTMHFDNNNGTDNINIAANGYVGIGTTNPLYKMSVDGILGPGNNTRSGGGHGGIDFTNNGIGYAQAAKIYTFRDPAGGEYYGFTNDYDSTGAQLSMISKQSSGIIGFYTGDPATRKMTILTNGNVGIGTTGPGVKLEVATPTANAPVARFRDLNSHGLTVTGWSSGVNLDPVTAGDNMYIGRDVVLSNFIVQSGNVGIGTTNPGVPLDVNGDIRALGVSATQGHSIQFANSTPTTKFHIGLYSGGLNFSETGVADYRMFIQPGGNVGIGNSNPTGRLGFVNDGSGIAWGNAAGAGPYSKIYDSGDLHIWTDDTTHFDNNSAGPDNMTINATGHVGIGITNPTSLLTVGSGAGFTVDNSGDVSASNVSAGNVYAGTNFMTSAGITTNYLTASGVTSGDIVAFNNVGIGTASPRTSLDVWGGAIDVTGSDHNGTAYITSQAGTAYFGDNSTANSIAVNSNGYVGIGTTNPGKLLSVGNNFGVDSGGNVTAQQISTISQVTTTGTMHANSDISTGGNLSVSGSLTAWSGISSLGNISNTGTFYSLGNVGIGTTNPTYKLQIEGSPRIDGSGGWGSGQVATLMFGDHVNISSQWGGPSDLAFSIYTGVVGQHGIGQIDGTKDVLTFPGEGSLNATMPGTIAQNSDIRLKENITPLNNSLAKVLSLTGVNFYWKPGVNPDRSKQIGFIAQDVEKVVPELVMTDAKGIKSVEYSNMTPLLVEAIKDQQKQIDDLKTEVEALKAK
jgi:hypothetical protein